MDGKVQSLILVDSTVNLGRLSLFQKTHEQYSFEILAQCESSKFKNFHSSLLVMVAESDSETSSYMEGLERLMSKYDAIFSFVTDSLFAFQARRCASKLNKRFVVIFDEEYIFPEKLTRSQKAIRQEIIKTANHIISSSKTTKSLLAGQGYPEDEIYIIPPYIANSRLSFKKQGREKFRKYIGLDYSTLLCLIRGVHDRNYLQLLTQSIHFLISRYPDLKDNLKIIWNDTDFDYVKEQVLALGLNQVTMLLNQDVDDFAGDLYSAVDVFFNFPHPEKRGLASNFTAYEIALSGVYSIGDDFSQDIKMQDETSLKVPINSPHEIADAIYNLSLRQKNFSVSSRQAVISSRKKQLQSDHTLEKFNETLSQIFQGIGSNNADDEVLVTYKSMLPDHFGDVEFVERVLQTQSLFFNADTSFLFDLAELNVKHGNYELAVKVYEAILEKLDRNFHAYYGLARISYLTHSDQEAMQFLKKALSIQPNHDASLRMIAYVHDRQGLSDDALTWLYKAYLCNPTETSLLLDLCQMSLRCDNNQKALKLIESIYQNSESEYQTSIVMALGHLYLRDGQYMLGQQMLDEAMHLLEAKAEHPLSKD